jgi:hypothetical protein
VTKKFDQWDRLQAPGQHVVVPGVRPMQVSKLAKANVRRRLGPRAVVVTAYIEEIDSTFVALAYVPSTIQAKPQSTSSLPEDRAPAPEELSREQAKASQKIRDHVEDDPKDEWEDLDESVVQGDE